MGRLLILSCSERKRSNAGLLPAIERYDGPAFRVLRRYLRQEPTDPPAIHILSAEFGLIPACHPIPDYDRRMTGKRAAELRPSVREALRRIQDSDRSMVLTHHNILVNLGRIYLHAVDPEGGLGAVLHSRRVMGPPGRRLAQLRAWLYEEPPALSSCNASALRRAFGSLRRGEAGHA